MDCRNIRLIPRLLSGELPPDRDEELREHLRSCPECQTAFAEVRDGWDALGDWHIDVPQIDLADRVLDEIDRSTSEHGPSQWWSPIRSSGFRVAASVVLAVGAGVLAGRLVPVAPGGPGEVPTQSQPATDAEAAAWLGLSDLTTGSATGLGVELERSDDSQGDEAWPA